MGRLVQVAELFSACFAANRDKSVVSSNCLTLEPIASVASLKKKQPLKSEKNLSSSTIPCFLYRVSTQNFCNFYKATREFSAKQKKVKSKKIITVTDPGFPGVGNGNGQPLASKDLTRYGFPFPLPASKELIRTE